MTTLFTFFTSHIIGIAETVWIVWEVRRAARTSNRLPKGPIQKL